MQDIRPDPTTEIEVSILAAKSHAQFEKIKDHVESRGLALSTDTTMDVNYSYEQGKTYRITIHRDIQGTLEPFTRNMSFKVFEGLCKTDRAVIHKVRKYVEDMPKLRLRVSEETPMKGKAVLKQVALSRAEDKKMSFRLKTRSSAVLKETEDYVIRVDLTKVASGQTFVKALDGAIQHEVEVELMFKRALDAVPKEAMDELMAASQELLAVLETKHAQKSAVAVVKDPTLEATPNDWMMQNRVGFLQWLYNTFKYSETDSNNNAVSLFSSQRFVRDYLQMDSPYRGLLLFHGLGVGKTCASIAAAEGFLQNHKKIIVMLPASLAPNYKREIMKCSSVGNPNLKTWNLLDIPFERETEDSEILRREFGINMKHLKKWKGQVWIPRIPDTIMGGSVKKTDVPWNKLTVTDQQIAEAVLQTFIDHKYEFVSFNGIKERQVDTLGSFDDTFVIMDEAHNFISRYVNGGKVAKKLYNRMMDAKNMKLVLLTGTPVINHPFELAALLNLVRGRMLTYEFGFLKQAALPSLDAIIESLGSTEYHKYIDTVNIHMDTEKVHITLLPFGYVNAAETPGVVRKEAWPMVVADMVDEIHAHLSKQFKVGKRMTTIESYALPTSKDEFQQLFLDESDPDSPKVKNSDLFMRRILGIVSYFRTAGAEFFPTVLPRVVHKIPMSPFQFARYIDTRSKERKMERRGPSSGLFSAKGTVYRAFSRMACNFTFPDEVKRPFPKDLRKELQKELSMLEEDMPTEPSSEPIKVDAKKVAKTYDEKLEAALQALETKSSDYLASKQLEQMYSPKFASLLNDIQESPGSCLLYSQFRTVEGLGIFQMVLKAAGYVEINVEKKGKDWAIVNSDEVLSPKYDGKRFVVFQEDREKTEILMRLFNSQWNELPRGVVKELQNYNQKENLYGEVAKVMMISQSGAEGISLRNVRRVMIMEPFWNMVRIDQVIGRAIRTKSHEDLPLADRNVQVFMYMATFTPSQLKQDFTLQRLDNSLSSDEHILQIANHKDAITRTFLEMLKQASVDCMTHAPKNKMTSYGLKCYAFPVNMEPSDMAFETTLAADMRQTMKKKTTRSRKIRGKVVSKNGTKYVVVEGMNGVYDYTAYKEAGVLVPATF